MPPTRLSVDELNRLRSKLESFEGQVSALAVEARSVRSHLADLPPTYRASLAALLDVFGQIKTRDAGGSYLGVTVRLWGPPSTMAFVRRSLTLTMPEDASPSFLRFTSDDAIALCEMLVAAPGYHTTLRRAALGVLYASNPLLPEREREPILERLESLLSEADAERPWLPGRRGRWPAHLSRPPVEDAEAPAGPHPVSGLAFEGDDEA